jgi:hypothetical protein
MALLNDALGVVQRKSLRRLFVSEDISSGIARRLSVRIFSSHFYRRQPSSTSMGTPTALPHSRRHCSPNPPSKPIYA